MNSNNDLYEFYGILMGDGCISKYSTCKLKECHEIRVDGSAITDVDYYYNYLVPLVQRITTRKPKPRFRKTCQVICVSFLSKEFAVYMKNNFNFPFGKKGEIRIKKEIANDFKKLKHVLRGFFDTDGSLYFTKNNSRIRSYPIIELSTHSSALIKQLKDTLKTNGFNVTISHYKDSVKLHGKKNLLKWMNLIGTNHPDKASKFEFWKKFGYCPKINELPYKERLKILGL